MATRGERRAIQEQQRAAKALASMAPESTCEIVLVRHGETAWNAEERLQGQLAPGPGLTDRGRRQAEALGRRLAREPLAALYSSDLLRARETAHIVAAARRAAAAASGSSAANDGGSNADDSATEVCVDAGLRERYLGVLQGLTRREAAQQHPEAFASLAEPGPVGDEGFPETLEQLEARAEAVLGALAEQHRGQRILAVSHGGFLSVAHWHAAGSYCTAKNVNASINTIRIEAPEGSSKRRWAVVQWGDEGHLSGVGALSAAFGGGTEG